MENERPDVPVPKKRARAVLDVVGGWRGVEGGFGDATDSGSQITVGPRGEEDARSCRGNSARDQVRKSFAGLAVAAACGNAGDASLTLHDGRGPRADCVGRPRPWRCGSRPVVCCPGTAGCTVTWRGSLPTQTPTSGPMVVGQQWPGGSTHRMKCRSNPAQAAPAGGPRLTTQRKTPWLGTKIPPLPAAEGEDAAPRTGGADRQR